MDEMKQTSLLKISTKQALNFRITKKLSVWKLGKFRVQQDHGKKEGLSPLLTCPRQHQTSVKRT
jgi:hypothetical protein